MDDTGVPLEHLVSCLPGIEIYQGVGCVKYLRGLKSKGNEDVQIEGELQIFNFNVRDIFNISHILYI